MRQFYEQWEPIISKSTATAVKLPITTDEIDIDSLLCAIPTAVAVNFNMEEFGLWVKMGVFQSEKYPFVVLWVKMGGKSGAML